jgi:hypothetical protein
MIANCKKELDTQKLKSFWLTGYCCTTISIWLPHISISDILSTTFSFGRYRISVLGLTSIHTTLLLLKIQVVLDVMLCCWASSYWRFEGLSHLYLDPGGEGTMISWNIRNGSLHDSVTSHRTLVLSDTMWECKISHCCVSWFTLFEQVWSNIQGACNIWVYLALVWRRNWAYQKWVYCRLTQQTCWIDLNMFEWFW